MAFPCCAKVKFVFTFTFSLFVLLRYFPSSFPFTPTKQTVRNFFNEANFNANKCKIAINSSNIVLVLLLGVGLSILFGLLCVNQCNCVRYVTFNTRLNLLCKKNPNPESYESVLSFSIAVTPGTSILCTLVFEIGCLLFTKHIPSWLPFLLILFSNDIHVNPGPHFNNSFFNFMNWNLNTLAKEIFSVFNLLKLITPFSIKTLFPFVKLA